MTESRNAPQPPPQRNDHQTCWDWVLADLNADAYPGLVEDIKERDRIGTKKYGTPLQPSNGRDALTDYYQEMLDATVYVAQATMESGNAALLQQYDVTLQLLKAAHLLLQARDAARETPQ